MLVDTHCHLDGPKFADDLAEVIARAREAGVSRMITMGTTLASSRRAVELAQQYAEVFAAVGIHPNDAGAAEPGDWDEIVKLATFPRVVAIGETGLDKYWHDTPLPVQQDYFARHIELAARLHLPFVVHTRESEREVLEMLRLHAARHPLSGVMHSFTLGETAARECVALGMHISFAGMVTYKKSDELRSVAKTIPIDRLLVETDSPYLSPEPLCGKRNEPGHVVHTATCVAAARGVSLAELSAQTTASAMRLFRLL
jgi:TatD DNase family protein